MISVILAYRNDAYQKNKIKVSASVNEPCLLAFPKYSLCNVETREAINYCIRTHPLTDLLGDLDHDRFTFALNPCKDGEMFVVLKEMKRTAIRLDSLGI